MSSVNAVVGPLSGSPSGSAETANNRQPYSHWTLEVNYYKRHLGDYAKDTGHLSALEHGVYTLLLDWYYSNERPIPAEKAIRIARGNPEETESVLREYFHLTAEGWVHHYADREIAEYHRRAEINRATGKLGGRPKKNPEKTETVSTANPEITLATSHKPVAIIKEAKAKADAPSAKRGQRLPTAWEPSDSDVEFAVGRRVNWREELETFRDFWLSKSGADACKLDWSATWRNWIRRSRQNVKPVAQVPSKSKTLNAVETALRIANGQSVDGSGSRNGGGQVALLEATGAAGGRHDGWDDSGMD